MGGWGGGRGGRGDNVVSSAQACKIHRTTSKIFKSV